MYLDLDLVYTVQENFSKGGRAGIFDLYPVVCIFLFEQEKSITLLKT